MELKTHTDTMTPVMRLIQKYAPNTYEAMNNAYWPVTLIKNEEDFREIYTKVRRGEISPLEARSIAEDALSALGLTLTPVDKNRPRPFSNTSWLNHYGIMRQANALHLNPVRLAATVLVHEWTHRRGYGEEEAYAAGAKFARAMGDEAVARNQEETGRQWFAKQQQQQEDPFLALFGGMFR